VWASPQPSARRSQVPSRTFSIVARSITFRRMSKPSASSVTRDESMPTPAMLLPVCTRSSLSRSEVAECDLRGIRRGGDCEFHADLGRCNSALYSIAHGAYARIELPRPGRRRDCPSVRRKIDVRIDAITAARELSPFIGRAHRDVHAMSRHIVAQDFWLEDAGRVKLGMTPAHPLYAL